MRHIVDTLRITRQKNSTLYTYLVKDDLDNYEEIQSLQEFIPGERVMVWYDIKWDKPKLKKYVDNRRQKGLNATYTCASIPKEVWSESFL